MTGLHKADKILVEPLHSYYLETAIRLSRSPRLLVVGYGFSHPHVNAPIARMRRIHGESLRVAVIDWIKFPDERGSSERSDLLTMVIRLGQRFNLDGPVPGAFAYGVSTWGNVLWDWRGFEAAAQEASIAALSRFLRR